MRQFNLVPLSDAGFRGEFFGDVGDVLFVFNINVNIFNFLCIEYERGLVGFERTL